jgi:hypothetical protein
VAGSAVTWSYGRRPMNPDLCELSSVIATEPPKKICRVTRAYDANDLPGTPHRHPASSTLRGVNCHDAASQGSWLVEVLAPLGCTTDAPPVNQRLPHQASGTSRMSMLAAPVGVALTHHEGRR